MELAIKPTIIAIDVTNQFPAESVTTGILIDGANDDTDGFMCILELSGNSIDGQNDAHIASGSQNVSWVFKGQDVPDVLIEMDAETMVKCAGKFRISIRES